MKRNYLELFQPLGANQVAPPFFLIVSKFFFEIGRELNAELFADLGAKLFSLIASVLSVICFWLLLNKALKNKIYIVISLLAFCFNPTAISYAQELKQYSTDTLFAIILIYIFYSINFKKDSPKKILLCSLIITFSIWFSSSILFIIASGFSYIIYSFIKERNFDKKSLIIFMPFIASFLIWYFMYFLPTKEFNYQFMYEFWGERAKKFLSYGMIKIFNDEITVLMNFKYALALLCIGIITLAVKKEYKILTLTLFPVIFCTVASFFNFYPFELRLILFLLPCLIIISMSVLLYLEENKATLNLLALFVVISMISQFQHSVSRLIVYKTEIRNQIQYIKNNKEIDAVVTFHSGDYDYYKTLLNLNYGIIVLPSQFETKEFDKIFAQLEKNRTYVAATPCMAGMENAYGTKLITYMQSNKNLMIIDTIYSKKDKNIFIAKFKKIK